MRLPLAIFAASLAYATALRDELRQDKSNLHSASTGTLVLAYNRESIDWMKGLDVPSSPFKEIAVISDSEQITCESIGIQLEQECFVWAAPNVGNEAAKYLHYIVEQYDNFPVFATFVHNHGAAWHDPPDKVAALLAVNASEITTGISFISGYCLESMPNDIVRWAWPLLLGDIYPQPFRYTTPCCAQFTVTRDAVLQRPKSYWARLYKFVLEYDASTYDGPVEFNTELSKNGAGFVLEWIWKLIFSTVPVGGSNFSTVPAFYKTCSADCTPPAISEIGPPILAPPVQRCLDGDKEKEITLSSPCHGLGDVFGRIDFRAKFANPNRTILDSWGCSSQAMALYESSIGKRADEYQKHTAARLTLNICGVILALFLIILVFMKRRNVKPASDVP